MTIKQIHNRLKPLCEARGMLNYPEIINIFETLQTYGNIEETCEINFMTLFAAMNSNVFYTKDVFGQITEHINEPVYFDMHHKQIIIDGWRSYFKDYGKFWALSREEFK